MFNKHTSSNTAPYSTEKRRVSVYMTFATYGLVLTLATIIVFSLERQVRAALPVTLSHSGDFLVKHRDMVYGSASKNTS